MPKPPSVRKKVKAVVDAQALEQFLALEAPFLLDDGRRVMEGAPSPAEARDALLLIADERLKLPEPKELWPFTTTADAVAWQREALAEQINGFFRRQEIKASITRDEKLEMFRTMLLTRELDNTMKRLFDEKPLKKIAWNGPLDPATGLPRGSHPSPQKGFRSWGQEACVGLALRLRRGAKAGRDASYTGDVCSAMIRDLGVSMMFLEGEVDNIFDAQVGKAGGVMGGRDLHNGDYGRGLLPSTAPLAISTQTLVGIAYAFKLDKSDRLCMSFVGEGGSSLGEWHESINLAAAQKLAMIFIIENNSWALGTHWREQSAVNRFASKAAGYGIPGISIFGNDPDEVAAASVWAAERARAGKGPALIELVTYRRSGHAHHDDVRFHYDHQAKRPGYELEEERAAWAAKDPIELYERRLRDEKVVDDAAVAAMRAEVAKVVKEGEERVTAKPWPEPASFLGRVFAERTEPPAQPKETKTQQAGYDEAIRLCMDELLASDPRVVLIGEDIGGRYGGAFGVTRQLAKRHGADRVLNATLAEGAIVGCGVGAAIAGKRPIVEMQFADFLACGFNALVNNAAKIHWRWGRPVPMVVRLPYGGATGTMNMMLGGGPYHSQCPEAWFMRTPGWKIVAPSTPTDAKGLLAAAVRDGNPVIYLEAKGLYSLFRKDLREEVPLGPEFEVPIGKAAVRRVGSHVTCITYGAMVWTALQGADELAKEGIELEVIDLRTLVPLDEETILASVAKTNRVMILHEDVRTSGPGAEIAAILAEKALYQLEAPIVRVTAPDTPVPYSPPMEHAYLPKAEQVVAAARRLMG